MISTSGTIFRDSPVGRLLCDYCGVSPGDKIAIVNAGTNNAALIAEIQRAIGVSLVSVCSGMEPFEHIRAVIEGCDIVLFLEAGEITYSREVMSWMAAHSKHAVYRLFDASDETIDAGFQVPKCELVELNRRLIALGCETRTVTIKNSLGTNLSVQLDDKYGWINSCGDAGVAPGVLPPSEAATYASAVDGILVADGALNTNFALQFDPRLHASSVTLIIEAGCVVDYKVNNVVLRHLLETYCEVPNARRIGEIGFGTNIGLHRFLPYFCHLNERFPSFHIGLGAHNQGDLVEWSCPFHLDLILDSCEIWFDQRQILADRRYLLPDIRSEKTVRIGLADAI